MRLLLTLFGRVIFDLSVLDDAEPDTTSGIGDGWERTDSTTLATDSLMGFVDDVGRGSYHPWE